MPQQYSSRGLFVYTNRDKGSPKKQILFYFIPEWSENNTGQRTNYITDSADPAVIQSCLYCTEETKWRYSADPLKQRQERQFQSILNRSERISGLRVAIYGDIAQAHAGGPDLTPGGQIQMMTAASTVALLDDPETFGDEFSEAPSWSESQLGSDRITGLLVRLAANDAAFFIPGNLHGTVGTQPNNDLNSFQFALAGTGAKEMLRSLIWRKRTKGSKEYLPHRLNNVRNAFFGSFGRGVPRGGASASTTGQVQMMTSSTGPLAAIAVLTDTLNANPTNNDDEA
jgi:hypothetical protein